jgi:hypothetical protein
MPLEDQILQAIRAAMPASAEIRVVPAINALNVGVSWKLNDDPERQNKMSKTIWICVSHEAVQDFASASAADQGAAYRRVSEFLSKKLAQFDPQHDAPRHEPPSVEKWVITSTVLLD